MPTQDQSQQPRVAILIEQNVEDAEFQIPYNALKQAGAQVVVLGSRVNEEYKGKQGKLSIKADATTTESFASDFDAVVIPGGMAPDRMRTNMKTVRFVQDAFGLGILVAAICHGPQVLIEGDLLSGIRATGFRSIRKDMQNAGANFVDAPLVVEDNLITSRRPGDLPIFTTAILQYLGLRIPELALPEVADLQANWLLLSEAWGGDRKSDVVNALNTAIAGERYGLEVFEHYAGNAVDESMRDVFQSICANKQRHLQVLESRLGQLGETPSLQVTAGVAMANLRNWFQTRQQDVDILRRALGDLQTGVVDTYNLRNKVTEPVTADIFDQMEVTLARDEQRIADLYRERMEEIRPPQPTSRPAVTG
uniref:Intracellular protease, PfpI family n=1 Tax=Cyanothece sp. (strain PCC 7425 / ATCC 29141) TaxID=395961 RepID=B8HU49_CYAP4